MITSEKIDMVSKALVAAQKEIEVAQKNAENPFFKSHYANFTAVVDAVKGPLNRQGLAFLQLVQTDDDIDTVETILMHESGQFISSTARVYCNKPNDPQAFGTGITYAKRYALQAALGLPTEDNDGGGGSGDGPPEPDPNIMSKLIVLLEENMSGKKVDKKKLQTLLWVKFKKYPVSEIEAKKTVRYLIDKELLGGISVVKNG